MFTMTDEQRQNFSKVGCVTHNTESKPEIKFYTPVRTFANQFLRAFKLTCTNVETGERTSIWCRIQFQNAEQLQEYNSLFKPSFIENGHNFTKLIESLPKDEDHQFLLSFLLKVRQEQLERDIKFFGEEFARRYHGKHEKIPVKATANEKENTIDDLGSTSTDKQKPARRSLRLFSKNQKKLEAERVSEQAEQLNVRNVKNEVPKIVKRKNNYIDEPIEHPRKRIK